MKRKAVIIGLGAMTVASTFCVPKRARADRDRADLIVRGAAVYTGRTDGAIGEAIAISGDRIVAVGSNVDVGAYVGPTTKVIEVPGGMVLPGFIDTHTHFIWGSLARTRVALGDATSPEDVERRLRAWAAAHPHEPWILGGDWIYNTFPASGPTKELLDRAVPDRPVALDSFDGHSMWLNSKALALAGITRRTPDILKNGRVVGVIVRDGKTGEPTGVLKEVAQNLALAVIPKPSREKMLGLIKEGMTAANAVGVTSVINASGDLDEMDLYETLRQRGKLTLRTTTAYSNINGTPHTFSTEELDAFEEARRRYTGDWVRAGIVKFFMDGVIEGHTAAMLAPYANEPGQKGRPYYPSGKYDQFLIEADRRGFAVMTHAIGDGAVREALDGYEAAIRANGPRDRRWRIEHIEQCDPKDVPRFGKLGIVASMQPYHWCCHDISGVNDPWEQNLGRPRWSHGFRWRDIARGGAMLVHGSDWPVVTIDPIVGVYSAITRQSFAGVPAGGWYPDQRLTLHEALAGYTRNASKVAFMEDRIGTLEPGKKADLVVLSGDLRSMTPREMLDVPVRLTILDGKVVHEGTAPPDRVSQIPSQPADACACQKFTRKTL